MTNSHLMRDKPGDDLLDHAVGKILLLRVAAQIVEWQDGYRRLVGKRERRRLRLWCRGREVILLNGDNRPGKPVTAAGQCFDPALTAGLFLKHATEGCDLDREVAFLDCKTRPRRLNQCVLGDWRPRPLHEHLKQRNRALTEGNGLRAAK